MTNRGGFEEYGRRDQLLRSLNRHWSSYPAYLSSTAWTLRIRPKVLADAKYKCIACGKKAWQVHHMDYEEDTLTGRDTRSLVAICDQCHAAVEMDGERKRSLAEANVALLHILSQQQAATRAAVRSIARLRKICRLWNLDTSPEAAPVSEKPKLEQAASKLEKIRRRATRPKAQKKKRRRKSTNKSRYKPCIQSVPDRGVCTQCRAFYARTQAEPLPENCDYCGNQIQILAHADIDTNKATRKHQPTT